MAYENILRETLEKIAKEQKYNNPNIEIKAITSGGANYTSQLFLATISEVDHDTIHLFAKIAAMGAEMRKKVRTEVYDTELFFYTDLLKVYKQIEQKNGVSTEHTLKVPTYYGANTTYLHEVLVLENLVKRGFTAHDRFKSITWEYAAAAITELAKLHALSMAYEEECPEKFKELLVKYKMPDMNSEAATTLFEGSKKNSLAVVKEENKEKLLKGLKSWDAQEYIRCFTESRCPVLLHCDFKPSNIMHKARDDGTLEVVTMDYQTLHAGCPIADLLYFIFTGTDAQFRVKYYQRLVDHYYEQLRAALTRLGVNPDKKYSKADFESELREKLPFGLAVAVFMLPIVTVEAENAPNVDESLEFSDFSSQKTGSLFTERLNGVVDDFVRWGVI